VPRYEVYLDDEVMVALRRLAQADDRTAAGMTRHLIRAEAVRRGLWAPAKPRAATESSRSTSGKR
jgi:predicted transcriptional regulator